MINSVELKKLLEAVFYQKKDFSDAIQRDCQNIYLSMHSFNQLNQTINDKCSEFYYYGRMVGGIDVIVDKEVTDNEVILATAEQFDVWKMLSKLSHISKEYLPTAVDLYIEGRKNVDFVERIGKNDGVW